LITFLNTSSAIDALTNQTGIVKACEIYVNDQGPLGGTSETDSEGRSAFDRVDINGLSTTVEQNNAYSKITAMDIVVQLLVGDGDDTRANRVALFNSNYSHVGVYTGSHSSEGHVTCINYADTYVDNVNDNEVALSETEYRTLDEEIIDAINTVRTDPASFATILTERLDYFDENGFYKSPGKFNFSTTDGKAAYEEAITFLGTFTAFTTNLTLEAGMNSAC
jgi:hypothetical protein